MPRITGVVVARDAAQRLGPCLDSLAGLDALCVIDHQSSDDTAAMARAAGARVIASNAPDLGSLREFARQQVDTPWMVMLDADERLPADGVARVRALLAGTPTEVAGYRLPIRTRLGGRWLRWGGYYPAARPRIFRISATRWAPARVHERPDCAGALPVVAIDIEHLSYRDLADVIAKTRRYAALAALDDQARGLRRGPVASAVRAGWRVVRSLLLRHGWLMGRLGWRLAWIQGCGVWWRYQRAAGRLRDR